MGTRYIFLNFILLFNIMYVMFLSNWIKVYYKHGH